MHRFPLIVAIASALALLLGLATRIKLYLAGLPLTPDETMLAFNVALRDLGGLARPLAFEQTAPLFFLWASRAAVRLGGVSEYALRATPFLAGVCLVPALAAAADELVSARAAVVAAALAMLCPLDIQYATTFKQYALDATITATQIALVAAVARRPERGRRWIALLVVCAAAPLASAASVCVTAPALVALALAPSIRRDAKWYQRVAGVAGLWAAVAATNFFLFQRATVASQYMQRFWAGAFPQLPLGAAAQLVRLRIGFMIQEVFLGNSVNYPAFWRLALLGVALLGIWHMIRAVGAWTGVLLVGPVGAVTILSLAHMYPLSDRTLLFLAPVCILSVVAGLDALTEFVRPSARAAVFACGMVGVLGPPAVDAIRWWRAGPDPRELRATTARVWHDVQRGEPVYIFSRDVPVWTFYTTDWTHPDTARVRALLAMAASTGPNAGNAPTRSGPVLGEGSTLVLRDSGRTELVGVPTGMEDTYLGARSRTPDSGWAVNEATRVRQVASPDAWLFFTYWNERVDQWLLDSLRTGGGRITAQVVGPTIRVYQYDSR
jgi:hypothetical protein